jgi:beta-mannosidase
LNDVWPSFSWSSIDYLGKEKLFHQQLKESYAPQLLTFKVENDSLKLIWIDDQFKEPYDLHYTFRLEAGKKGIGTGEYWVHVTSNITELPEVTSLAWFKHKSEIDLRVNARTPYVAAYERNLKVRRELKK